MILKKYPFACSKELQIKLDELDENDYIIKKLSKLSAMRLHISNMSSVKKFIVDELMRGDQLEELTLFMKNECDSNDNNDNNDNNDIKNNVHDKLNKKFLEACKNDNYNQAKRCLDFGADKSYDEYFGLKWAKKYENQPLIDLFKNA